MHVYIGAGCTSNKIEGENARIGSEKGIRCCTISWSKIVLT